MALSVTVVLTLLVTAISAQLTPSHVGAINITLAGFSNGYEHPGYVDPTERYSLLVSTFSGVPFSRDSTYMFEYVGKYLDDLISFVPTEIYDDFSWPREASQTPEAAFGFASITQPDGFLTPGKNNGSLFVSDIRDMANILTYDIVRDPLNPDPTLWFYHAVTWKDINNDGLLDALTCRASDSGANTEMIWFQQPDSNPLGQAWKPTVINRDICGTFQYGMTFDIPGEGPKYALFTVGYFTHLLAVHWSTAADDSWLNPADIQTMNIDTGRDFFDIDVADLNKDGTYELLVSWAAEFNGSFVAYEIPEDFRTCCYPVHVLADGFNSRNDDPGGTTPGVALAFYPTNDRSEKPWIVLTGDDDGRVYYLTPASQAVDDWQYDMITIIDEGPASIVGRPTVMDVDGDNYVEVFIPSYYGEAVEVFTFKP